MLQVSAVLPVRILCLVAFVWLLGHAGVARAVTDEAFSAANVHFLAANDGDDGALALAVTAFTKLVDADASDPVALAYLGASTAMLARTVWAPWSKIARAEDGMHLQDKALALLGAQHDAAQLKGVPVALSVKFVSASTFLAVPEFFKRRAQGEKLLDDVLNGPTFAAAPLAFRGGVWLRAAKHALKVGSKEKAAEFVDAVLKSGAPQASAAAALLAAP